MTLFQWFENKIDNGAICKKTGKLMVLPEYFALAAADNNLRKTPDTHKHAANWDRNITLSLKPN